MKKLSRLGLLRRQKGIRQQYLADLLHVSTKTISRWEAGDTSLKAEVLSALAAALGTSTAYLLGETDDPKPRDVEHVPVSTMQNVNVVNGDSSNSGNMTVNTMSNMQPKFNPQNSAPWWVYALSQAYTTAPQDIEVALDTSRTVVKVLEQARASVAIAATNGA